MKDCTVGDKLADRVLTLTLSLAQSLFAAVCSSSLVPGAYFQILLLLLLQSARRRPAGLCHRSAPWRPVHSALFRAGCCANWSNMLLIERPLVAATADRRLKRRTKTHKDTDNFLVTVCITG
jgi:hypothetical protein